MSYMTEKIRKTVYVPDWIGELLDTEGGCYDGPGVVVSAAIYEFCCLTKKGKIEALNAFRQAEISRAYETEGLSDKDLAKSAVSSSLGLEKAHGKKRASKPSKSA
jgi:hypothetical protein